MPPPMDCGSGSSKPGIGEFDSPRGCQFYEVKMSIIVTLAILVLAVAVGIFIVDKTLPDEINQIAKIVIGVVALIALIGIFSGKVAFGI